MSPETFLAPPSGALVENYGPLQGDVMTLSPAQLAGSLPDVIAIQQMVAAYAFDEGDAEAWAGIFHADGVWERAGRRGDAPTIRLSGHQELAGFCRKRFADRRPGLIYNHHQSGVLFDSLSTNAAQTRTMLILTVQPPGELSHISRTGVYHDEWVRTPAGWRLALRLLTS